MKYYSDETCLDSPVFYHEDKTEKAIKQAHRKPKETPLPNLTKAPLKTAGEFLSMAKLTMDERGKTYDDSGKKERSMKATVEAFNAITGKELSESDGWLLMVLLKQVRQYASPKYHGDSALDAVAYSALLAESLSNNKD